MTRTRPIHALVAVALAALPLSTTRLAAQSTATPAAAGPITAIEVGRLIDPETGTTATNQIIEMMVGGQGQFGDATHRATRAVDGG